MNPTETKNDFRLTFLTNRSERVVIGVPRANPELSDAEVRDAMDGILAASVIITSRGTPSSRYNAELITRERTSISLFAS